MTDGWDLVADNRRAFADLAESLTPAQADAATLCGHWTAHEVAGHLTTFTDIALPKFMFNMARAGFDYDKAADRMAKQMAERPVGELAASLRAKAAKKSAMPMFPPEMTLTDVAVHTQDIRRPLELAGSLDDNTIRTALTFLTTHKQARNIVPKNVYDGLALEATDLDWSYGSGAAVRGPGEALLMAMTGRPVFDELEGDGVELLRSRFA